MYLGELGGICTESTNDETPQVGLFVGVVDLGAGPLLGDNRSCVVLGGNVLHHMVVLDLK